ncbi:hypothetical protein MPSEU_000877800 [Mayamaea pseudoterrestris]|nr:hypothetical protein MPSEU_000877800 [Mayamaea pseudoterrestris]
MTPEGNLTVDCYVDADFAGLYGKEDGQDPVCAQSRTGYLIMLGGCPVFWQSKLQTEIALSTMESEYVALSSSLRQVIPIQAIVKEMGNKMKQRIQVNARSYCTVYEDNAGCLALANAPHLTPRSRHYATKYHHFKHHVKQGTIKVVKIDTKEQRADIFTKALPQVTFEHLRRLLMGW